jgi:anti-sigma-K factor RskA
MADDPKQLKHDRIADELPLYALGALGGAQCANIQRHLEECATCRQELAQFRGDAALLALSTAGAAAPQRSRSRLLDAIEDGPRALRVPAAIESFTMRRPWWSVAPVFASLALAVVAILLLVENIGLRHENEALTREAADLQASGEHARQVMALLNAPDAAHITLVAAKSAPAPQIKTIYQQRTGRLLLMANNLPSVPAGKAYELWLVPMQGVPMPAGVFKPDSHGSAMYMPSKPMVPPGTEVKAFAVTIEAEAGVDTATSPVVMMGAGQ